ncbi:MAG: aminoacyl-histidine dipeptidase [Treponema sp.]
MNAITDREPKAVFYWFAQLSAIPRGSGNEQAVSDFLVQFAHARNLTCHQDEALNVIIKKPGTAGYEHSHPIILQGHMDMVCEKTPESSHDFLKDPIKLMVEGDILHADGTTLGGDDGIAVAYALAILDSDCIAHPPLEVLITTNEETGMDGAKAVQASLLHGKMLFNIDSEEEGIFLVSCAGGAHALIDFPIETEPLQHETLSIAVSGLYGGHSGAEIDKQRANALKVLARLLYEVKSQQAVHIVSISGGSKHNAIAKEATACISLKDSRSAQQTLQHLAARIADEYRITDKNLHVTVTPCELPSKVMFTQKLSADIIDFMMMIPNGVQYMSADIPGLVQTSLNAGILQVEGTQLRFTISVRSSVKSALDEILHVLHICADKTGATFIQTAEYPAWEYAAHSPARDIAVKTYTELTGKTPIITAIHAGLECGLLKEIIPDMDAVSFGPNLYDIHTPNERLSISSVERTWHFIVKLLENLR